MTRSALHSLLEGVVDYAGLFPPAGLAMAAAVANFGRYRQGPQSHLLGRFVIPVSRLAELVAEADLPEEVDAEPWELSAVVSAQFQDDRDRVEAFDAVHRVPAAGLARISSLELRPSSPGEIREMAAFLGPTRAIYFELPVDEEPAPWIAAVHDAQAHAKIRTGGVTADAIPPVSQVARFLRRCHEMGVSFKATAGLHHPLRAERNLTYEPDSPRGTMHGFLNLFTAALMTRRFDLPEEAIAQVLSDPGLDAWSFGRDAIAWRGHVLSRDDMVEARHEFAHSFGSCSFEEPIDDLQKAKLL